MTVAEQLRTLLFFEGTELVEDPSPDSAQQIPHLKGDLAENVFMSIYRHYAGLNVRHGDLFSSSQNHSASRGLMSLEEFVLFVEHLGVRHTHCPHDENDEVSAVCCVLCVVCCVCVLTLPTPNKNTK